jgi:DNA-binding NarL/FixJ family response regulator
MNVLIVDDHALVREALGRVLLGLVPDARIVEAGDPATAFRRLEQEPDVDLALLDLTLPGMHGLAALKQLRAERPTLAVVIVSATVDRETVRLALEAGAAGYIPKTSSNEVLRSALQLVLAGGFFIPPEFAGRTFDTATAPPAGAISPASIGLTERQAQILALVMKGEPNKVICRELDLAESTVKNQITTILKALKVTNRTQAVLQVTRLGLALPEVRRTRA